jgi:phage anti-repressor protein
MNQIIAPKTINFNDLVKNSNTTLSLNLQTKMTTILNEEFTEEQQQWYIANLFMYMNYHPTNDYPINLEDVFKMIGFANKGNAMKTIKSNFVKDEDYKTIIFRTEKNKLHEETRGRKEETVMLNIDTFKNLCMFAKTQQGKEIRKYYVKLENIYNKIIKEEIENQKLLLEKEKENTQKLLKEKEKELSKEKTLRNKMLNRRCFDVEDGEYVYLYQDILGNSDSLLKIGKSTKLINREEFYSNINKSGGIVFYIKCIDCSLIEKICHHMLDKFRVNKMQEWFKIDLEMAKSTIKNIVKIVDSRNSIPQTNDFLQNFKGDNLEIIDNIEISDTTEISEKAEINVQQTNTNQIRPDDFSGFLENCCEIGDQFFTAKEELTKAFRIYTKNTIEKSIKEKLNTFLKNKFKSGVEFYDNIRRNVWRGFRLKPLTFSVNDNNNITDYEKFILDKCQINYLNRVSYADFFDAFINYKKIESTEYTLSYKDKIEIQNYLTDKFANGRVHLSENRNAKHLFGVLGLSLNNESGLKESKRTCKKVSKCNLDTGQPIQTWESLTIASKETGIPRSTLAHIIKFKMIKENFLFKYTPLLTK